MKFNIQFFVIVSLMFFFVSCQKTDRLNETSISQKDLRLDELPDENFMNFISTLPTVEIKYEDVLWPTKMSVKEFHANSARASEAEDLKTQIIQAAIQKAFDLCVVGPPNYWPALPPNGNKTYPEQNKIGYSLGSKQYIERAKINAPSCNNYAHALDCSGLVSLCFLSSGISTFPDGTVHQSNAAMLTTAIQKPGNTYKKLKFSIFNPPVDDIESGDIIVFYKNGKPKHDGVYVKNIGGITGLIQSNGNNTLADCETNLSPVRGPRIVDMNLLITSCQWFCPGSGWTWNVLRIVADKSPQLLTFDEVDTPNSGYIDAAAYFSTYEITISNISPMTTAIGIINDIALYGGDAIIPPTTPNVLSQVGSNGQLSYRLNFATPLTSFSFKRSGLFAGPNGITHPAWTARAFNALNVQVSSVNEGVISSTSNVSAASFTLSGPNIAYVVFETNNSFTAFNSVILDDLYLQY